MGADEGRVRPHAENPERPIVCQDDLTACVEHAKAVRHVVESRVQPRRQRCGLLLRGDHPVEIRSEAFGRSLHVEDQRRDAHDDPHGVPTARDKHGCAQRSKGSYELHVDAAIDGVTARHQAEGVGDRHRHADKLGETVGRYGERKQSPQREAEQTEEGAKRENPFLMARNFDGGARHAPCVATYKVEPKCRDRDLSSSRVQQHGLPGRERGGDFAAGDRNGRKQHHRDHVVEQAVDESDVDLVRQLVGSAWKCRSVGRPPYMLPSWWVTRRHCRRRGLKSPLIDRNMAVPENPAGRSAPDGGNNMASLWIGRADLCGSGVAGRIDTISASKAQT